MRLLYTINMDITSYIHINVYINGIVTNITSIANSMVTIITSRVAITCATIGNITTTPKIVGIITISTTFSIQCIDNITSVPINLTYIIAVCVDSTSHIAIDGTYTIPITHTRLIGTRTHTRTCVGTIFG